jgi:peptide deformylase
MKRAPRFRPWRDLPILAAPDPRPCVISTPVKTIDGGLRTRMAEKFEQMYDTPGIGPVVQ